ncbi:unnamed protein product [Cylindrotheca closterium]|uniref:Uncharacterized protein n=1 Tax=Cylindrotheca closterium TaxID=2856 RepID=A0AAD2CIX9_9STRA|nr:unnamed protein product [Cylindrotheca closterium]
MPDTSKRHNVYQFLFLVAAICLNLPPVALGIMGCMEWCGYFASWLAANAALSATNAIAALYIIQRMRKAEAAGNEIASTAIDSQNSDSNQSPADELPAANIEQQGSAPQVDNTLEQLHNSDQSQQINQEEQQGTCCLCFVHTSHSTHLRHLIRYDGFVSTYCIFVIFWLFWLSDGVERVIHIDKADADDLENCSLFHEHNVLYSFCIGFVYLAITISSLALLHLPERKTRGTEEKAVVDA